MEEEVIRIESATKIYRQNDHLLYGLNNKKSGMRVKVRRAKALLTFH